MVAESRITSLFPSFEKELVQKMSEKAQLHEVKEGDMLMKTGQYIQSTQLILQGLIKTYREDDEGDERLLFYLKNQQRMLKTNIL